MTLGARWVVLLALLGVGASGSALVALGVGARGEGRLEPRPSTGPTAQPTRASAAGRSRTEASADGATLRSLTSARAAGVQLVQNDLIAGTPPRITEENARPAPLWTREELEEARATGHAFPIVADAYHLDEELYQQPVNIERTTEVEAELRRTASSFSIGAHFEGATCSDDLCRVVVVHTTSEQRVNELNTLLGNGPLDGGVLMVPRPAPANESVLYFSKKGTPLPLGVHADAELTKQTYGTAGPDAPAPPAL